MHIPDDIAQQVNEALAGHEGLLDDPTPAGELRRYHAQAAQWAEVQSYRVASDGADVLPLHLTVPAWRKATEDGEGTVGVILGNRRFIAHEGMDIEHTVMIHDETGESAVRFTLYLGGPTHYHAVAPVVATIRETPRGPVVRISTQVVACKPPKALLAAVISGLLEALGEDLDPEDFQ